ncbi:acetylxylan esterase [Actinotalea sp. C106]|uniref:acetylxylan esterase n=1 Tax=Actinotalea sp. C106 TaxID=2908644 RepID=UPI002028AA2E|nr:acetylxylan esterase [Actinotalea sp. C106]
MALFDLPLDQLRDYRPDVAEPEDFDAFWELTLAEARSHDLALEVVPVDTPLTVVEAFDVTFAGFGGHPVKGWLTRPAGVEEDLPVVVEYLGYGGGRGLPHERLTWAAAGYAHLVMDTRGQGSTWGAGGATQDPGGSGPAARGVMTRGVEDPVEHYYRRLYTDAVRAVDAARELPGVDPARVAIAGISQGGGVTLAVSGLVPDLVAVMPDVPFLCHVRRAVEITDALPYGEITQYLSVHRHAVETVFRTWSYLDAVNFARRATAPALFSVALMDQTCPPSTVYAAYNHYGTAPTTAQGPGAAVPGTRPTTEILTYPFNQHEGGQAHQVEAQLRWLRERV